MELLNKITSWKKNIKYQERYKFSCAYNISKLSGKTLDSLASDSLKYVKHDGLKKVISKSNPDFDPLHNVKTIEHYSDESMNPIRTAISWRIEPARIKNVDLNYINTGYELNEVNNNLINCWNAFPGFTLSYLRNPSFTVLENKKVLSSYKYKRGLKILYESAGEKYVDISDRPGRINLTKNFPWHGAMEYWIGRGIENTIPFNSVASNPNIGNITMINDDIIHIKICDWRDYWNDESQRRIHNLRTLLKVDESTID